MRFAVLFPLVLMLGCGERAGIVEDCNQTTDRRLAISSCTEVIDSGKLAGKDLAPIYFNRGVAYSVLGKLTHGIEDFDQAIRLDPEYALAYTNRGWSRHVLGKHTQAIEDFGVAIRLNPRHPGTYENIGNTYHALGDPDQAIRNWEKSIEIEGDTKIRLWQGFLTRKGYYAGAVDGIYDTETKTALMACARDLGCL